MRLLPISTLFISLFLRTLQAGGASFREEPVAFPTHDGFTLEGTLRLPSSASDAMKVPALVLIHGSGPQSRDQVVPGQLNLLFQGFAVAMFRDIAVRLAAEGIAVLTYDKRTCGPFNGLCNNSYTTDFWVNSTVRDYLDDAVAAVNYLETRQEVDEISVAGHSQSGPFVPIMLQENPDIYSGILMESPFHAFDYINSYQINYTLDFLDWQGVDDEAVVAQIIASLVVIDQGLKAIRNGSQEPVAGASAAFWTSWLDSTDDAQDAASTVNQKMLILHGELDTSVPVSEAFEWDKHLTQVVADYELAILPCVTHALNCLAESDRLKVDPATDPGKEVDEQVTDTLIRFLVGQEPSQVPSAAHPVNLGNIIWNILLVMCFLDVVYLVAC